jgi:hypothetical protein
MFGGVISSQFWVQLDIAGLVHAMDVSERRGYGEVRGDGR